LETAKVDVAVGEEIQSSVYDAPVDELATLSQSVFTGSVDADTDVEIADCR
jgi:hypothetical protein